MSILEYNNDSLIKKVEDIAKEFPNNIAYEFMGSKCTYTKFIENVHLVAKSLIALGVKENDIVCVSMPNTPQAITFIYALNKIGATANMIHPLSSEGEMEGFLNKVNAKVLLMMDQFYPTVRKIRSNTPLETVIIASIKDALPMIKKLPYSLTIGRKIPKISKDEKGVLLWNDLLKMGDGVTLPTIDEDKERTALILHSGGTTGKIKGVMLSNKSVNASAMQMKKAHPPICAEDRMLTVMPIFHGNGLVIGVHAMLITGARCILIPRFTPESYAKDLLKYKCNYMSGVPALFERLMSQDCMQKADLSFLKGVFSGADSLSVELEKKINEFLKSHNAKVLVRQGYGMTEGVVASSLTPLEGGKLGSIGVALPDVDMKIVEPGTSKELPTGEVGEIVFSSVTNMQGYYNDSEETNITLKLHEDGKYWVHSGDLGSVDEDGFFYFKGRIKRMIITNGYNVFPMELENALEGHELIDRACVVGIPDEVRGEKVKAFLVLKEKTENKEDVINTIKEYLKTKIAKYALPRDYEIIDELPKTKIGKVDYHKLIERELEKSKNN